MQHACLNSLYLQRHCLTLCTNAACMFKYFISVKKLPYLVHICSIIHLWKLIYRDSLKQESPITPLKNVTVPELAKCLSGQRACCESLRPSAGIPGTHKMPGGKALGCNPGRVDGGDGRFLRGSRAS